MPLVLTALFATWDFQQQFYEDSLFCLDFVDHWPIALVGNVCGREAPNLRLFQFPLVRYLPGFQLFLRSITKGSYFL